jgi:hypothetical protein
MMLQLQLVLQQSCAVDEMSLVQHIFAPFVAASAAVDRCSAVNFDANKSLHAHHSAFVLHVHQDKHMHCLHEWGQQRYIKPFL